MDTSLSDRIAELEKRRARWEGKRQQAEREVADIDQDLVALRRVADRGLLDPAVSEETEDRAAHGELRERVRRAVMTMPGEFTTADIYAALVAADPTCDPDRSSISSCLRRLADPKLGEPELFEVEKGTGRRMSRYTRVKQEGVAAA